MWISSDADEESDDFLKAYFDQATFKVIHIVNKTDLANRYPGDPGLRISAKTGEGMPQLKLALEKALAEEKDFDELFLTKERQTAEVQAANDSIKRALSAFSLKMSDELAAAELRNAGAAFDRLLGKTLNEDVLDLIFSRFCIGK